MKRVNVHTPAAAMGIARLVRNTTGKIAHLQTAVKPGLKKQPRTDRGKPDKSQIGIRDRGCYQQSAS